MPNRLRVGIVGASVTTGGSGWGANAHVPALAALPDYELLAVCTAHAETAEASAKRFGAPIAFHDFDEMIAHPDVDLIAVVVRVPMHYPLVKKALLADKAVFCEWPLAVNVEQAEELASLARERNLRTIVGLQGRSNAAIMYARDLIRHGFIGTVLSANLSVIGQANIERGEGRIWQGIRANGANPMTIAGGHNLDGLCALVGEITELSARIATKIPEWKHAETGEVIKVDAPDVINIIGSTEDDVEVAICIATVPANASGTHFEIFGSEGVLLIPDSASTGSGALYGSQRGDELVEMPIPPEYTLVPEGTPLGSPRNVAQAYARFADSLRTDTRFEPDFEHALRRHRLLAAVEESAADGREVSLNL